MGDRPIDRTYRRLCNRIDRLKREIDDSGLSAEDRAALMTMVTASFMGTAAAMLAAIADRKAGRPKDSSPHRIPEWMDAVSKRIAEIMKEGIYH